MEVDNGDFEEDGRVYAGQDDFLHLVLVTMFGRNLDIEMCNSESNGDKHYRQCYF